MEVNDKVIQLLKEREQYLHKPLMGDSRKITLGDDTMLNKYLDDSFGGLEKSMHILHEIFNILGDDSKSYELHKKLHEALLGENYNSAEDLTQQINNYDPA